MAQIGLTKYTSQYIDNLSFDDGLKVSMVEIIGADGVLKNPATEAKQDAMILTQSPGQTLYDKTSGSLDYKGKNTSPAAPTSSADWLITKYVRSGGSLTQKLTKTGSWDNRVTLF